MKKTAVKPLRKPQKSPTKVGKRLIEVLGAKPVQSFENLLGPEGIWDDEDFQAFQQWLRQSRKKGK